MPHPHCPTIPPSTPARPPARVHVVAELSERAAGVRLGINRFTLRGLVLRGVIPAQLVGSRLVFRADDVDAYASDSGCHTGDHDRAA